MDTSTWPAEQSRTQESVEAPQLLTPKEVADLLGVPISWVYKRTERGAANRLPHIKLGKYVRFHRADLERWLEHRTAGAGR